MLSLTAPPLDQPTPTPTVGITAADLIRSIEEDIAYELAKPKGLRDRPWLDQLYEDLRDARENPRAWLCVR
ncbi:hypothetical protein [Parafrankia discariae]|uniref:hypothetical protein n=1 Tax=Parafrankia discariae TaxID=365528 RepID=UPI0003823838|nr:hypothetical protein [Parafrankia discariae]